MKHPIIILAGTYATGKSILARALTLNGELGAVVEELPGKLLLGDVQRLLHQPRVVFTCLDENDVRAHPLFQELLRQSQAGFLVWRLSVGDTSPLLPDSARTPAKFREWMLMHGQSWSGGKNELNALLVRLPENPSLAQIQPELTPCA